MKENGKKIRENKWLKVKKKHPGWKKVLCKQYYMLFERKLYLKAKKKKRIRRANIFSNIGKRETISETKQKNIYNKCITKTKMNQLNE